MDKKQYWPFPIPLSEEKTEESKRETRFLETAHQQGYKPYTIAGGLFGASAECGRIGEIIHRGKGRYWQVLLAEQDSEIASGYFDGFDSAAEAVLRWLHGENASDILSGLQQHVVSKPGARGW